MQLATPKGRERGGGEVEGDNPSRDVARLVFFLWWWWWWCHAKVTTVSQTSGYYLLAFGPLAGGSNCAGPGGRGVLPITLRTPFVDRPGYNGSMLVGNGDRREVRGRKAPPCEMQVFGGAVVVVV